MPLNKSCVGKEYPPVTIEPTLEAMQRYARAYNDDNPAFFDAKRPGAIVAPPMYGVVAAWPALIGVMADQELKIDLIRLLHSEQDMEFLGAIRPGDNITSVAKVAAIEARATGETLVIEINATNQRGEHVQRMLFSAFIRGRGNRAAAGEPRAPEPRRGEPIVIVQQTIDQDQTYRYRDASGDLNPIHVDQSFAKMAGLPGIIVHGLCTMAFTSKVAIDRLCGGDPLRLKRLYVRFTRPVFPGQTITTRIWPDGERDGRQVFAYETLNPDGQAVVKGGIAEIAN